MRGSDKARAQELVAALHSFDANDLALPGIQKSANEAAFVEQLLESIHRVRYISVIYGRNLSPARADPSSPLFDPIKAAIIHHRQGNLDEACWLVFLSVHFGRHLRNGWRLCADVYGGLGNTLWDWPTISTNLAAFRRWLAANQHNLKGRGFGNHRKYESLDADSPAGTATVIRTYVQWIDPPRDHKGMFDACESLASSPKTMFHRLYQSMDVVARFGRTAKFDYLTMIGKLKLASIEPGIPYMKGATGPLRGAKLLVSGHAGGSLSPQTADEILVRLGQSVGVGMQVIEDALCNWQKAPTRFKPFRG